MKGYKKEKVQVNIREVDRDSFADKLGESHMNILPRKKLLVLLCSLSLTMMLSFADQTGVSVALPEIGEELQVQSSINWATTASLLANCVCQILFGRLSDIFGRKCVLIVCLIILCISDLCCSFAQTGIQFYIFRAFAGIGNGGVSSLTMVILSDVVTLKQRGKYQGILGSSVGIGNSVGPFIMAAFIEKHTWRGFYYFLAPAMLLNIIVVAVLVQNKKKSSDLSLSTFDKIKQIDFLGIVLATLSLIALLVPISGGGSSYRWDSPLVISLLVVGGVLFGLFLIAEWKSTVLPMIPLHLFKIPSLCLILTSNFLFGMVYYSFLFYLPYHFTIVKQKNTLHASIFILPLVLAQAVGSIISGQIISRTGHYIHVVVAGYSLWCLSNGLLVIWDHRLNDGVNIVVLLLMGTGVGFTFQPTMVACQAQSKKSDRAVVISTRNVLRSFGGAVGTAIAATIVSNTLLNQIAQERKSHALPAEYLDYLESHIYSTINTSPLSKDQVYIVIRMYEKALRNFYYLLIPLIGVCLISSFFVKDRGLQSIDETPERKQVDSSASSMS